jgi:hypothetical protein
MYPLCGPVAFVLSEGNPELYYASMAAILEGSVFGDHCSFISDTTIMSAMACKCPLTNHVATQLPYAVFIAVVSVSCGYVPIGMQALSVIVTYLVGFGATIVGILILGANPGGTRLDLFNWISSAIRRTCCRTRSEDIPALALMNIPLVPGVVAKLYHNEDEVATNSGEGQTGHQDVPRSLRRPSFEMTPTAEEDDDQSLSHVNNTTYVSANKNPFDADADDESDVSSYTTRRSNLNESAISINNEDEQNDNVNNRSRMSGRVEDATSPDFDDNEGNNSRIATI